jgi:hypothetical protein
MESTPTTPRTAIRLLKSMAFEDETAAARKRREAGQRATDSGPSERAIQNAESRQRGSHRQVDQASLTAEKSQGDGRSQKVTSRPTLSEPGQSRLPAWRAESIVGASKPKAVRPGQSTGGLRASSPFSRPGAESDQTAAQIRQVGAASGRAETPKRSARQQLVE